MTRALAMRLMAGVLLAGAAAWGEGPARFYADDPLAAEPKARDASKAMRRKISDYYDFFAHMFAKPGEQVGEVVNGKVTPPIPARAVNTLGEPMASAWWQPRHYYKKMSLAELTRGAGSENGPSKEGKWTVVKAKSEGVTPGFEILDAKKRRFVLKFDPLEYPEIATAPDALVSKLFYALGYNVPENYIVHFTREDLVLGEDVQLVDAKGTPRKMTQRDVTELLMRVPRTKEGLYRGGASLYLPGKPVGPYKYAGMRRDDPNDIVPHEHRRDLRGLGVFCAWVNHDDSRAINSLDMLHSEGGVSYVKHYLIDFGSTLGSASNGPNSPRSGFEYLFEKGPAMKNFFSLGLAVPYWARAQYPAYKSVGRFESKLFRAAEWVPEYPNPAFVNRLADDNFWAAKQVMAFTDEEIRAIVKTGEYSDVGAEKWVADALIERRDKIGRAFLTEVLPLDRFRVEGGKLAFDDLAAKHGLAKSPGYRTEDMGYKVEWSVFDNGSGAATALGAKGLTVPEAPGASYVKALVKGEDAKKTIAVYLRRGAGGWDVVGLERGW
ncbi:MAG: hypothetical protein J0L64_25305 [Acidobacteria bacterium]|nr:hypothetical protein [Acidobacteriota bacterium]